MAWRAEHGLGRLGAKWRRSSHDVAHAKRMWQMSCVGPRNGQNSEGRTRRGRTEAS